MAVRRIARMDAMKPERPKKTARIILDHVGRKETTEQLRRMPGFNVPTDTRETFGPLLDKLDQSDDDDTGPEE